MIAKVWSFSKSRILNVVLAPKQLLTPDMQYYVQLQYNGLKEEYSLYVSTCIIISNIVNAIRLTELSEEALRRFKVINIVNAIRLTELSEEALRRFKVINIVNAIRLTELSEEALRRFKVINIVLYFWVITVVLLSSSFNQKQSKRYSIMKDPRRSFNLSGVAKCLINGS